MNDLRFIYGSLRCSLVSAGILSGGGIWTVRAVAQPCPEHPNLLFICTDQQQAATLAAYGNDRFLVPNLNALSEESIVFANTYVVQPVSTPSRGTLLTGLYPAVHGACENDRAMNESARTLPELLPEGCYVTGYFGKWHLGDEIFAQHGFEEFDSVEDVYFPYYSERRERSARSGYHHFLRRAGFVPDDSAHNLFTRKFVTTLPYEYGKPAYLAARASDFLKRHRNSPFVLYVGYLEPHTPFNGPFDDLHDTDSLLLSPACDCRLTDEDPVRYRLRARNLDRQTYGDMNRRYAGLCHAVDRSVGYILQVLDSLGLRENTIVVFTSDHGEMMGAHGLSNKSVMYEPALRVPLIMRVPWLKDSVKRVECPVSSIDIVPTLLDLMGYVSPKQLPGRSLMPIVLTGKRAGDDGCVFALWNPNNDAKKLRKIPEYTDQERIYYNNASFRTVISPDGWKLTLSNRDRNQLFNLREDPDECNNLYYSGTCEKQIDRLWRKIRRWQKQNGDSLKLNR